MTEISWNCPAVPTGDACKHKSTEKGFMSPSPEAMHNAIVHRLLGLSDNDPQRFLESLEDFSNDWPIDQRTASVSET